MGNKVESEPRPNKKRNHKKSSNKKQNTRMKSIPKEEDFELGINGRFNSKMTINDFTFICVVGKGSHGKAMSVKKNDDGKMYVMRVLKKKELTKRVEFTAPAVLDRKFLSHLDHPFISSLQYSFQSDAKLYLVSDHCIGGGMSEYFCFAICFVVDHICRFSLYSSG